MPDERLAPAADFGRRVDAHLNVTPYGENVTPYGEMNFRALTKRARPSSITSVQVADRVDRPKRESGATRRSHGESNPGLPPQLSATSPSPGCHWALFDKAWEGGEGR